MSDAAAAPAVSKPLLLGLGAVAALALLYVFVVSPLLAPAEAEPLTLDLPAAAAAAAQADQVEVIEEEGALDDAPLPETFEVFSARDPFQQLVQTPATSGGTGATGDPATPVATPVGASPGTGAPAAPADPPTGTPATRVGTTVVKLVDITTVGGVPTASITVNGTPYEVVEAQTFAGSFRVLDISGRCATLLFGDSRFTLCTGDEIRK